MKILYKATLVIVFLPLCCSCTKASRPQLEVKLDTQKRPMQITTFVVKDGVRIKHGESIDYNWLSGAESHTMYEYGKMVGGDFDGGGGTFLEGQPVPPEMQNPR